MFMMLLALAKKKKEAPKKIYTKETKLSEVGKHWECMENWENQVNGGRGKKTVGN